jgi:C-terminal processing protease CtpA/Prc
MTKLKSVVVFTVMVCITGSFHKDVKAQMNLGGYCYSCAYNPMYPHLDPPSARQNSNQIPSRSNNNSTHTPNTDPFFQNTPVAQPEKITGVGLNLDLDKRTKRLIVVSPVNGTPAANAGILAKDVITQIDGVSTQGMTTEQGAKLIRGTEGTNVTLGILRNGLPLKFRLTRVNFRYSSNPLNHQVLDDLSESSRRYLRSK